MYRVFVAYIISAFFSTFALAEDVHIVHLGTVQITQRTNEIEFEQDYTSKVFENSDTEMADTFIVTTPLLKYRGADGVINPDESVGLKRIPWDRKLQKEDFVLFPFFSKENTTIGFLDTSAGGSGGSAQDLWLLDTATNRYMNISSIDMYQPQWKSLSEYPPTITAPENSNTIITVEQKF